MARHPGQTHPSRARLLVSTVMLIGALAGMLLVTGWLTTLSKASAYRVESRLRYNSVTRTLLPKEVRSFRTRKDFDLVQHFLVYMPFGVIAAGAGGLAVAWRRDRLRWVLTGGLTALALGAAAYDEWRQLSVPTRSACWSDLFAGWSGILCGLVGYLIVAWMVRRIRAAVVRRWPAWRSTTAEPSAGAA